MCDLESDCKLTPVTIELGATAPSISPDGQTLCYFVDETTVGGGRLTLKRVGMDGLGREALLTVDTALPGTNLRPSRPYPLSTISSDGRHLAISAFLGDGHMDPAPWGLMVFNLEEPSVRLILHGPTWCNMHPQYSRSPDAEASHDILIQENHDNVGDSMGRVSRLTGGNGADIHVIRDDGNQRIPVVLRLPDECQQHSLSQGTPALVDGSSPRAAEAAPSTGMSQFYAEWRIF